MRYLLLIYTDETSEVPPDSSEVEEMMAAYNAYTDDLRQRGQFLSADALQPTTTATTVRLRDGETLTTDGPFAETKEQLGGFYLVECANLDEAIEAAAKIPSAKHGSIEVRPVMEFD